MKSASQNRVTQEGYKLLDAQILLKMLNFLHNQTSAEFKAQNDESAARRRDLFLAEKWDDYKKEVCSSD